MVKKEEKHLCPMQDLNTQPSDEVSNVLLIELQGQPCLPPFSSVSIRM